MATVLAAVDIGEIFADIDSNVAAFSVNATRCFTIPDLFENWHLHSASNHFQIFMPFLGSNILVLICLKVT